ncbi:MAG: alpha/beta hydrolase [Myxococcales bacterium]|nr:alpha/beta hydrolase [Myxococcales bacterium]MCB9643014.1 alpha/beta hydrolase [Myxococcales bacterium]
MVEKPTVILLHGLGIDGRIWGSRFLRALQEGGFHPIVLEYPSTQNTITQHAARIGQALEDRGLLNKELSFVCHSLGGLIFLRMCEMWPALRIRTGILISSPVRGSRMAHEMERSRVGQIARKMLGPVLSELAQRWRDQSRWGVLEKRKFPLHIIYGRRPLHPFEPASWLGRWLLPETLKHDGVVCEDEIDTSHAHSTHIFPYAHNQILREPVVHLALLSLLRHPEGEQMGPHLGVQEHR